MSSGGKLLQLFIVLEGLYFSWGMTLVIQVLASSFIVQHIHYVIPLSSGL